MIVYNEAHNEDENLSRQQVQSYLAIKYGIHLDQTSATDYVSSTGSILMWDSSENTAYNKNIFGIGRDDSQALDQRVSSSVNSGSILTVALDNDFTSANTSTGRTTTFANDLSFVTFANNAGSLAMVTNELPAGYTERIEREWQVQIENHTGSVNLHFTGMNGYTLLSDTDGDFSTGSTVLGTLDANGEITNVTLTDNTYLALAKNNIAPG
jgi:hypothetical protein